MGWKGTVRSINSAMNEAQRSAARRQRELARQHVQANRMAEVERAGYEVAVYENTVDVLTTLHRETPALVEWGALRDTAEPQPPEPTHARADAAKASFD